ncbi:MAG TPA: hypothetical protein VE226_01090 [Nitrososphaeraceae archaeon]|nr:hypothetical protein [Nitrososphaeraceae archaeon]
MGTRKLYGKERLHTLITFWYHKVMMTLENKDPDQFNTRDTEESCRAFS